MPNAQQVFSLAAAGTALVGAVTTTGLASGAHSEITALFARCFSSFPERADEVRFGHLIAAAATAGWGTMLFRIAQCLPQPRAKDILRSMREGVIVWFLLDTGGSIAIGATYNLFVNGALLGALLAPLIAMERTSDSVAKA